MEDLQKVVVRPVITEKSNLQKEGHNQITFEVSRQANKIEIKKAVERLFKVQVMEVNTMNVRGKVKRLGRNIGKRPNWKKAIVTLKEGERIDFFEGV
jgi:large subunit ribosomal protein L23